MMGEHMIVGGGRNGRMKVDLNMVVHRSLAVLDVVGMHIVRSMQANQKYS